MTDHDEFLKAIAAGDLPRVEAMLRDRSLATAMTDDDLPALIYALHKGHPGIARAIASRLPSMTLHEAAALGDLDRVRGAVTLRPSELNAPGPDGNTPLGSAVRFGNVEVARYLLEQGASPNMAGGSAIPPLHTAITLDPASVAAAFVELLLNAGADAAIKITGGWTPLHAAAAMGYRGVAGTLIDHGAARTAKAENEKTPADVAAEFGFDSIAAWLSEGND
jgi:ankyrin repeat protein